MRMRQPLADTACLAQDAIDGATGPRQSLPRGQQVGITRQIVEQGLGSGCASQAFGRLIAQLDDAVDHHLADTLGGVLARTRLAVQDGFILGRRCCQALAPLLDPAPGHAHRLGILLLRPGGVLVAQTT